MADNTILSASTGTGDTIRTEDKGGYKTPVSLIDVGGTGSTSESIIGDSTHCMPVSGTVSVSGSTISITPLTTATTIHIAPLTTNSTISVVITGGAAGYTLGTTGSTGDTLTVAGAYRKDTAATLVDTTGDVTALQVDSAGKLWVNASGSTIPVTLTTGSTVSVNGTVSVSGSTISIAPLTTASTVHVTGTVAATQSGTWSLTTATTINVVITAGAAGGGASTSDDAVFTPGSGLGTPIMGLVTSDEVSTGDVGVLAMTTGRQLKCTLYDSTGGELAAVSTLSVSNSGTFAVQVTDYSTTISIGIYGSHEDESVFTPSTSQGVAIMGVATTDAVSTGEVGALSMTLTRQLKATLYTSTGVELTSLSVSGSTINANVSQSTVNVIAVAGTAGGVSVFNKVGSTVIETTTIKTSAGQVYGISGYNNTLAPIYVKLYNTTAAPTTSDTAVARYILPATTVTGAAGFVEDYACPIAFSTGIGIRITGGSILDSDTAVAATTASLYTVNVRYA
jgi:hypothetical protein